MAKSTPLLPSDMDNITESANLKIPQADEVFILKRRPILKWCIENVTSNSEKSELQSHTVTI